MLPLCLGLFLGLGMINGFFADTFVYTPVVLVALQVCVYAVLLVLRSRAGGLRE